MPNYCHSNLSFERINEAAKEKFFLLTQRLSDDSGDVLFSKLMQDGTIDEEEMLTRSWQHENIGPKWTYIEDYDEESLYLSMNSAWSPPTEGVEWLIAELAKVDPNLISVYTYQEEQPDYAGYYVYLGEEMYDGYEDDYDEIVWAVENEVPELTEMKDEDGHYTEEGWELYHENVYEVLEANGSEFIADCLLRIQENEG